MDFRLQKNERISKQKEIDYLFEQGNSFISFPLRVICVQTDLCREDKVSIFVSVPKRKLKKAVDRNRVKRLIKEAYRLNKNELKNKITANNNSLLIGFVYVDDKIRSFDEISKGMKKALSLLEKNVL